MSPEHRSQVSLLQRLYSLIFLHLSTAISLYPSNQTSYVPQDTATYNSQFYFKTGTNVGWEAIRWPWILHYSESVGNIGLQRRTFEPIPLVIGEQPMGYLMVPDLTHDVEEFGNTNTISDGILSIVPGLLVIDPPLFSPSSLFSDPCVLQVCFTYTLDQFGGLCVSSITCFSFWAHSLTLWQRAHGTRPSPPGLHRPRAASAVYS